LLLYDVTNKTSYDNIRAWLSEIREHANEDVVIMLLGESRLIYGSQHNKPAHLRYFELEEFKCRK
jgi:GTPase SAR1 family protein